MARLTETERDLIAAARVRGAHPALRIPSLTDISAAALRRQAETDRNRFIAELVTELGHRLVTALRRKRVERRTRRALEDLSDAVLSDIGIRRDAIVYIACERARKLCPVRQHRRTGRT